jgi:hypothetical protein
MSDLAPSEDELKDNSVLGAKLEAATAKSLRKADEILDIPLDPERRHYHAYHATRRALGVGLSPWGQSNETPFAPMGAAQLTDSGTRHLCQRPFGSASWPATPTV